MKHLIILSMISIGLCVGLSSAVAAQPSTFWGQHEIQGATPMAFKDLPWSAQKVMLDHSSYAHIESVDKYTLPDGRTAYRGVYPKENKRIEIRVTEDGTVLSEHTLGGKSKAGASLKPLSGATKVSFSELPKAAQHAAKAHIGSAKIEDIDKGTLNGKTVYELAYKKDGRTTELRVTEDGKILGEHFD